MNRFQYSIECVYVISLIMEKYQISQNLLAIYSYIKIHKLFVHHQCGKYHVKRIPKFLKVSQSKSVQNKKNAENWKNKNRFHRGLASFSRWKNVQKVPKPRKTRFQTLWVPKNRFPGLSCKLRKRRNPGFFLETFIY